MPDDLAAQLQALQSLRQLLGEESYQTNLQKLRAQYGDAAIDALLGQPTLPTDAPRSHTLVTTAQTGVAVAGDVHGNVYLHGQRTRSNAELLASYLQRMTQRCATLPLQGVREQKTADDVLAISLDQVYTQLATTDLTDREFYEGAALKSFDARAYLAQHVGELLLPGQQRYSIAVMRDKRNVQAELAIKGQEGFDLRKIAADQLAAYVQGAADVTFFGPQLVSEAIAEQYRLVLLGEPGSGKSTALRYLALTLAAAGLDEAVDLAARLEGWGALGEQGRLLPIFLPLLPLAKRLATQKGRAAGADDLWNYIADQLEARGRHEGLASAVHEELEAGRALLLLDGLDEVAGADSRRGVVRAVRAFAEQYPQCRMVVACRVRAYQGEQNQGWRLPRWPTATLADWTVGQMEHFIAAWYRAAAAASGMAEPKRDERIAALRRAIAAREDLQRLGVRPLLLTVMALVHFNDGRLPEDRVALYSRCLDLLLSQWEVAGKDETDYGTLMAYIGLPDAEARSLRALLEEAAFLAHEASAPGSPGRLGRAALRELVADELRRRGHPNPWDGAERFLEYADVRAGVLQASDAGDAYVFPHQTFQEYLAGLKLVSGLEVVRRIMERRRDDRWRLPILLGVADHVSGNKLEMPYFLLCALLSAQDKAPDEHARDLLLAAEIGEDVGWDRLERGGATFAELRRDLARALAGVVEGTALPAAERARAGVYLGQLGDPRPGVCTLPPAMVEIAGGSFLIGESRETASYDDEIKHTPLMLPTFAIARYPLTNAQYGLFIDDDGYDPDKPWWDDAGRAWLVRDDQAATDLERWQRRQFKRQPEYWDDERFGQARPNQPVVGVTWYEAIAFCRWLTQNRRYNPEGYVFLLPSEAEWEYATRGTERRIYPWGNEEPDGERANFEGTYGGTTAVGCFPLGATPEGVYDLAGNVWEWTRSVYAPYPYDPADGREDTSDPAQKHFTPRGGSWYDQSVGLRASGRDDDAPDLHNSFVGLRLARHLPV